MTNEQMLERKGSELSVHDRTKQIDGNVNGGVLKERGENDPCLRLCKEQTKGQNFKKTTGSLKTR